ncbi:MAG: hypothetical protein CO129_03675 [Ignavibacteriales bacterium CG_4_9_14_3_um_filter_34_10]|nr:MAG: hypothetical protein CO129_03675 [Ignavibacteriales bacterium CG_4_9_14_3_um_filter_34_10]
MNKFDELTNKYFDNDISQNELTELNEFLKDPNNELLFKATQNLESILRQGKNINAPEMIEEKFMNKILHHKTRTEVFPIFIASIFILSIVSVFVFVFSFTDFNTRQIEFSIKIEQFIRSMNISPISFSLFVKNKIVTIIGLSSSFFLLLSFLLSVVSHKAFKEKINKYSGI